jgi:hypothetical protein
MRYGPHPPEPEGARPVLLHVMAAPYVAHLFCRNCPHLTRISWNGTNIEFLLTGYDFKDAANLAELTLGNSLFHKSIPQREWERKLLMMEGAGTCIYLCFAIASSS